MAFQFVAFALIALIIVFLIERVYRKLMENEKANERLSRRIMVLDERYQKQSRILQQLARQSGITEEKKDLMKKCPNCNNFYASNLLQCPYCNK